MNTIGMPHLYRFIVCAAMLPGAGSLAAQDAASTLAALTARAGVIVQAMTPGMRHAQGAMHEIEFVVERRFRGTGPSRFVLQEPVGDACGRALSSIAAGRYVLFLSDGPTGLRLAVSGSRAVVPLEPALAEHLQALANTTDPDRLVTILAADLQSSSHRVRRDAALALAHAPRLERAGAPARGHVASTLRQVLATGTHDLLPLLTAAERLQLTECAPELLAYYLEGHRPEHDRLLLDVLPRFAATQIADGLAQAAPADDLTQRRSMPLLRALPADQARPLLTEILRTGAPATAAQAGAALLTHGADPQWVAGQRSAAVLASSQRLHTAVKPRFRSILQETVR